MDLVLLLAWFLGVVSLCAVLWGIMGPRPFQLLYPVVRKVTPNTLGALLRFLNHKLLKKRTYVFQVGYVLVWVLLLSLVLVDAAPLQAATSGQGFVAVIFALVLGLTNMGLYVSVCRADPGRITSDNYREFAKMYPFDGRVYHERNKCRTCSLDKPARSKHCSVCDQCVHRFDHHCIWTNSCVGGRNHFLFLLLLTSCLFVCLHVLHTAWYALENVAEVTGLWNMRYVDSDGTAHGMTFRVAIQELLLQFPRLVTGAAISAALSGILLAFCTFHLYLALTNQTTNEWLKPRAPATLSYTAPRQLYDKGRRRNWLEFKRGRPAS